MNKLFLLPGFMLSQLLAVVFAQPIAHIDTAFPQPFSIKYHAPESGQVKKVLSDRNGNIQVLTPKGVYQPYKGAFLYPGTLVPDRAYRPMAKVEILDMQVVQGQFVYLTDSYIFSNAWAGKYYQEHGLKAAEGFVPDDKGRILVFGGREVCILYPGKRPGIREVSSTVENAIFDKSEGLFKVWTSSEVYIEKPEEAGWIQQDREGMFTYLASTPQGLVIGNEKGYKYQADTRSLSTWKLFTQVPATPITCISEIEGKLWFGTAKGAFMLRGDGKYDYYQGERWLPCDTVNHIAMGPDHSVLILTPKGLSQLKWESWTLEKKAMYYEKQVRNRHIRHGLNASLGEMQPGDLATGILKDSDNDGLWTAMYLASQVFRYVVDSSAQAWNNCQESLDAMERLFSINPVQGFPSRSFERRGYKDKLAHPERWQSASDPKWDWKATTSSDEAIGHMFAYGVVAELLEGELKARAIRLMDSLMTHIVENEFYLVDYDGKPTMWGRWNPEYVNSLPIQVGDRKLNSSNIIAMLQTAYHFTGKELFKEEAYYLMEEHGFLENLLKPMSEIGQAPESASEYAKMLSENWNHSDDEMYFLGYWGLYRYAFTDSLRELYKHSIWDHWESERPEKEGLWNIFAGITGKKEIDLEHAIWYLQEYPLDLIDWGIQNSHRQDITQIEPNFRNQRTLEVLPPDERPIQRHNGNTFTLDRKGKRGTTEYSAGDIWLLPYWMGRYLMFIKKEE